MLYLEWLVTAFVVFLPVLALTVKGGANTCLYLLVLAGLIGIVFRYKPMGQTFLQVLKKYWYVHLSMAGTTLAILAHQLGTADINLKVYDISSRLTYFALIAWALLLLPSKYLKHVQWGIVAGAFAVAIKVQLLTGSLPSAPTTLDFLNRIPYGDMSLLLAVFCFFSIGWTERKDTWAIALKIAAGCAALYATYLCQSRGGWVALPLFGVIGLFLVGLRVRHKIALFALVLALLGVVYSSSTSVQARIKDAATDITLYRNGQNLDTSVGIRFQHWRGSWILFKEHPVFGIGRENFYPKALTELHSRNIISQAATDFVHPHNELLFYLATLGIFGFAAYWALHLIPAYFFYRAARDPDLEIRTAGSMGLALVLGFFIFGLTEVIFFTPAANAFFSVNAAIFFACVVKRKQALANQ
ncbi:MAG: O-antigen ligase [Burkholderiales bacterium]